MLDVLTVNPQLIEFQKIRPIIINMKPPSLVWSSINNSMSCGKKCRSNRPPTFISGLQKRIGGKLEEVIFISNSHATSIFFSYLLVAHLTDKKWIVNWWATSKKRIRGMAVEASKEMKRKMIDASTYRFARLWLVPWCHWIISDSRIKERSISQLIFSGMD